MHSQYVVCLSVATCDFYDSKRIGSMSSTRANFSMYKNQANIYIEHCI
jgi:hypothetical protein